ncbi:protein of unknown function DUF1470 [Brevibacterium linens]|uniref:Zinc finger CGNR domain-containing protein n=2 Tax=Brevibacterium linens TaxID=1703 RepID=A0A0B8ZWH8_BRELN|nr:protein of unknown function DUF1470 [Brevibacterium linens]
MLIPYDVRSNIQMLVDLLNTAPGISSADDRLASPENLSRFVRDHDFSGSVDATTLDVRVASVLRERFRVVLGEDVREVVAAVNLTFDEIRVQPRLVEHDHWGWHLHAAGDRSPLGERMASDIALVLTDLIRTGDLERLRACAGDDCSAALADFTRNHSKRFCDVRSCANRTHLAASRARRASGD